MTYLAQPTIYFNNHVMDPEWKFEYDPHYRLIRAEGRELNGLGMATDADFVNSINLQPGEPTISPASPPILQHYTQVYSYDELGNLLTMSSQNRWLREYFYTADGSNNYLIKHTENGSNSYAYDKHGNTTVMPHLSVMNWDYRDRLIKSVKAGIPTWYTYDFNGKRVRKITEKTSGITEERIYLSGYEVYRLRRSGTIDSERQTVHIEDDKKRIALVDTLTIEEGNTIPYPVSHIRYQYDNHLGSACLELDEEASVISYEEYHPFGTTSYRSGRSEVEVSLKRYKYCGKERDEESGLFYYGARYYAAWIGRFVSVDPLKEKYPFHTPFCYAGNRPISLIDKDGLGPEDPVKDTKVKNDAIPNGNVHTGQHIDLKNVKGPEQTSGSSGGTQDKPQINIDLKALNEKLSKPDLKSTQHQGEANKTASQTNAELKAIYDYWQNRMPDVAIPSESAEQGVYKGDKLFIETWSHYQTGKRKDLNVSTSALDFSFVSKKDLVYNAKNNTYSVNLFRLNKFSQTSLTLGKVSLNSIGKNRYTINRDYYDFNIEWKQGFSTRNVATFASGLIHGPVIDNNPIPLPVFPFFGPSVYTKSGPYWINFSGSVYIKP
jgi:RHS repeat-associated protein